MQGGEVAGGRQPWKTYRGSSAPCVSHGLNSCALSQASRTAAVGLTNCNESLTAGCGPGAVQHLERRERQVGLPER
jgi:hypothetical protein